MLTLQVSIFGYIFPSHKTNIETREYQTYDHKNLIRQSSTFSRFKMQSIKKVLSVVEIFISRTFLWCFLLFVEIELYNQYFSN